MTKLLPKTTGRYWTEDGIHVGPTTSWLIEWTTHDTKKCHCAESWGDDFKCEPWDCWGLEYHYERVFSEDQARKRAAEILAKVDYFCGPRWIEEELVPADNGIPFDHYEWEPVREGDWEDA